MRFRSSRGGRRKEGQSLSQGLGKESAACLPRQSSRRLTPWKRARKQNRSAFASRSGTMGHLRVTTPNISLGLTGSHKTSVMLLRFRSKDYVRFSTAFIYPLNNVQNPLEEVRWEMQESQNHRIVGVGRDLCGSSSPTPCPSRVTQSRLHSTAARRGWNISREGDSTASLGSLGQGSVTLRGKKFFLKFRRNFLCLSLCPLPLVLSLGTTGKSLAPSS